MRKVTKVRITDEVSARLQSCLGEAVEVAGMLTCTIVETDTVRSIVIEEFDAVADQHYRVQQADQLAIRSRGWVPALQRAARRGLAAAFVHTHPLGNASFSTADDTVDSSLAPVFCDRTGQAVYLSIVIAGEEDNATAIARTWSREDGWQSVESVSVVGERLRFVSAVPTRDYQRTDRQARALSRSGDSVVAKLIVGVVGMGGTGSPVVEQLLRLGVAELVVIDPDEVTETTLSRGAGFAETDVGRPKVDIAAALACRIGGPTKVTTVMGDVTIPGEADRLLGCDVVVCATDNHASRLVLNRFAFRELIPVIDCGVLVDCDADGLAGVFARCTWVAPGAPCLLCLGRIDAERAAAELLDADEAARLAGEGYVPELGEPDPSVVTFATLAASLAASVLLLRVAGLGDHAATEIVLDLTHPRLVAARRRTRPGCFCDRFREPVVALAS